MGAAIETRAGRAGVHFIGHLGYPQGVLRALHAADVVVVPSVTTAISSEQGPRVVIEAMLTGCLVVGSTCGAIPEMIQDRGLTFTEGDIGAMTSAVQQAIRRVRRDAMTHGVREHALTRYSTAAACQQLSRLWQDVLSGSARAEQRSHGGSLV
jgi:glycosyltransferase involved in cell wall biosynthesis